MPLRDGTGPGGLGPGTGRGLGPCSDKPVEKPEPAEDESESEYMARCVPMVMEEGKAQNQAVAICYSLWRRNKREKERSPRRYAEKTPPPAGGWWR